MAIVKEIIIAAIFTAIAVAQLPNVEVPGGLPVNQSMPAIPETPAGNNTQIPAIPENPAGNNTQIPGAQMPDTNGTVPAGVTVPPVPGQESTEPSRFMNAINAISGLRGKRH